MATYLETADDSEVLKRDDDIIDIDTIIAEYLAIKNDFLNLPDYTKTVPDQETLDFWNVEHGAISDQELLNIKQRALLLYQTVKPVFDAGLLPDRYTDQYNQLEAFVT